METLASNFNCCASANENYDNYFNTLRKWMLNAKEYEQAYINAHINSVTNIQNNLRNEVNNDTQHEEYYVYTLPPIWKRFVAELIDFLILVIIKLYISFIFLSTFHMELSSYELNNYFYNPKLTLEISTEIAALEVAFRIIVCLYESYWLRGGSMATPGKSYMGLKVCYVTNITVIQVHPQMIVRAYPCTALGWRNAIFRALLKNIFVGILMFPVCFGFIFFNSYRTGYDILTKSLVVENNENPPRQRDM